MYSLTFAYSLEDAAKHFREFKFYQEFFGGSFNSFRHLTYFMNIRTKVFSALYISRLSYETDLDTILLDLEKWVRLLKTLFPKNQETHEILAQMKMKVDFIYRDKAHTKKAADGIITLVDFFGFCMDRFNEKGYREQIMDPKTTGNDHVKRVDEVLKMSSQSKSRSKSPVKPFGSQSAVHGFQSPNEKVVFGQLNSFLNEKAAKAQLRNMRKENEMDVEMEAISELEQLTAQRQELKRQLSEFTKEKQRTKEEMLRTYAMVNLMSEEYLNALQMTRRLQNELFPLLEKIKSNPDHNQLLYFLNRNNILNVIPHQNLEEKNIYQELVDASGEQFLKIKREVDNEIFRVRKKFEMEFKPRKLQEEVKAEANEMVERLKEEYAKFLNRKYTKNNEKEDGQQQRKMENQTKDQKPRSEGTQRTAQQSPEPPKKKETLGLNRMGTMFGTGSVKFADNKEGENGKSGIMRAGTMKVTSSIKGEGSFSGGMSSNQSSSSIGRQGTTKEKNEKGFGSEMIEEEINYEDQVEEFDGKEKDFNQRENEQEKQRKRNEREEQERWESKRENGNKLERKGTMAGNQMKRQETFGRKVTVNFDQTRSEATIDGSQVRENSSAVAVSVRIGVPPKSEPITQAPPATALASENSHSNPPPVSIVVSPPLSVAEKPEEIKESTLNAPPPPPAPVVPPPPPPAPIVTPPPAPAVPPPPPPAPVVSTPPPAPVVSPPPPPPAPVVSTPPTAPVVSPPAPPPAPAENKSFSNLDEEEKKKKEFKTPKDTKLEPCKPPQIQPKIPKPTSPNSSPENPLNPPPIAPSKAKPSTCSKMSIASFSKNAFSKPDAPPSKLPSSSPAPVSAPPAPAPVSTKPPPAPSVSSDPPASASSEEQNKPRNLREKVQQRKSKMFTKPIEIKDLLPPEPIQEKQGDKEDDVPVPKSGRKFSILKKPPGKPGETKTPDAPTIIEEKKEDDDEPPPPSKRKFGVKKGLSKNPSNSKLSEPKEDEEAEKKSEEGETTSGTSKRKFGLKKKNLSRNPSDNDLTEKKEEAEEKKSDEGDGASNSSKKRIGLKKKGITKNSSEAALDDKKEEEEDQNEEKGSTSVKRKLGLKKKALSKNPSDASLPDKKDEDNEKKDEEDEGSTSSKKKIGLKKRFGAKKAEEPKDNEEEEEAAPAKKTFGKKPVKKAPASEEKEEEGNESEEEAKQKPKKRFGKK